MVKEEERGGREEKKQVERKDREKERGVGERGVTRGSGGVF